MLSRLTTGASPAIAFIVVVIGLASYDAVAPPLISAARGGARHISTRGPANDADTPNSPAVPEGEGLVEGTDWSLIDPDRGILHWTCDDTIPVQSVGPAPDGAKQAITTVVADLARLSGLDLVVSPAEPKWSNDEWRDGEILVRYVDPDQRQAPHIAFDDEFAIGRGGPISMGRTIIAGHLAIRSHESAFESTDPTTRLGQAVLLHELGHTIGAGHSHDHEGVMTPRGADVPVSPGDKYVFRLLGCPQ